MVIAGPSSAVIPNHKAVTLDGSNLGLGKRWLAQRKRWSSIAAAVLNNEFATPLLDINAVL